MKHNPDHQSWDAPDCYKWRLVFAWWPVKTIGGRYVWLSRIYKQKFWSSYGEPWAGNNYHMTQFVEYADLFELLQIGWKPEQ